jgi:hypothetical protein
MRPMASEIRPSCLNAPATVADVAMLRVPKYRAAERQTVTRAERGELLGAPRQSRCVVQTGGAVDQAAGRHAIHREFRLYVNAEAQQQLFGIDRMTAQLPGAGA